MSDLLTPHNDPNPTVTQAPGPFGLENTAAYAKWRARKLTEFPRTPADITVALDDLARPGENQRHAITANCRAANMSIYASQPEDRSASAIRGDLAAFASAFGLGPLEAHRSADEDGFVALEVAEGGTKGGYIPYTNRPLSWHTDGYYNKASESVRAMILHCVRDAAESGENALLDPEIAYIRLRDENPEFVAALMHPEAMTIPANTEPDGTVRPASVGPVFSVEQAGGTLRMRYTARKRNIAWRDDPTTAAAVGFLERLLTGGDEPLVVNLRLAPGQGLICNNVLHNRTGFRQRGDDGRGRLYYRGRYLNRIKGT